MTSRRPRTRVSVTLQKHTWFMRFSKQRAAKALGVADKHFEENKKIHKIKHQIHLYVQDPRILIGMVFGWRSFLSHSSKCSGSATGDKHAIGKENSQGISWSLALPAE